MKTYLFLIPIIAVTLACGQQKKPDKQVERDSTQAMKESMDHVPHATINFITNAAFANLKEIRLGQLAKQKAVDERIRKYGIMMVKDHTTANQQLEAIAKREGVTMPADLKEEDKKTVQSLNETKKDDFDRTYIKEMIHDHKKTIAEFDKAKNSKDTAISNYSENLLPKLNSHQAEATTILEDMRKLINKSKKVYY